MDDKVYTRAYVNILQSQRNDALNAHAEALARVIALQEKVKNLEALLALANKSTEDSDGQSS